MEPNETLGIKMREIDRLRIIRDLLEKKILQRQAAEQLDLSVRQVRRISSRVRQSGSKGVIHGLRGRPGNHKLAPGLLERALKLVAAHYRDFGPAFANEKLQERHGLQLSAYALRKGMIKVGLWRARRHKPFHRAWRPRKACLGEMVQVDGSDHDWFEGRGPRCVLMAFVDDATSRVVLGRFGESEDTLTLMRLTWEYLRRYGRPQSFYVDKDSIYKINRQASLDEEVRDEQPMTQFSRAMSELGITVICANSPQAKGRVERLFKTLQDRLVKDMRLAGISSIEAANRFVSQGYWDQHNARFQEEPANHTDAHRKLLAQHRLERILCLRTERTLLNDYTLQYQKRFFQVLEHQPVRVTPRDKVEVEIRLDNSTWLRFKEEYLNYKTIPKRPYRAHFQARPSAAKQYDDPRIKGVGSKPSNNHPWKRLFLNGPYRLALPSTTISEI
jgi:transposase